MNTNTPIPLDPVSEAAPEQAGIAECFHVGQDTGTCGSKTGEIPFYIDALFETISGFTTTGSSILSDVEALSYASLFWRSFTHWIGGMGVFVFIMAILPMMGGSTMNLMRAESPGAFRQQAGTESPGYCEDPLWTLYGDHCSGRDHAMPVRYAAV